MGFRFYRRFKILPGVRVNLSRSGISTSIGRRGAWFTIGKRGTRETVSLPGSGISYSMTQRMHRQGAANDSGDAQPPAVQRHVSWWKVLALAALVWMLVHFLMGVR
jgi:hypothetical protein